MVSCHRHGTEEVSERTLLPALQFSHPWPKMEQVAVFAGAQLQLYPPAESRLAFPPRKVGTAHDASTVMHFLSASGNTSASALTASHTTNLT